VAAGAAPVALRDAAEVMEIFLRKRSATKVWNRLLRKLRNLYLVRLQQASCGVIHGRNRDLIADLGLQ
jgi:hypothetical protein